MLNVPESEKGDRVLMIGKNDDLEYLRGMMSDVKLKVPFSQVSRIGAKICGVHHRLCTKALFSLKFKNRNYKWMVGYDLCFNAEYQTDDHEYLC